MTERQLYQSCTKWLSGHPPRPARERLAEIAAAAPAGLPDEYGGGSRYVTCFEDEIARLLGKESAVFAPKGMVLQQAALRSWTDRSRNPSVLAHPQCHVAFDEDRAVEHLHPMRLQFCGTQDRPLVRDDLPDESGGVLLVELPLRRAGFVLPTWDSWEEISGWARRRGLPLHLDGARLWECQAHYGRDVAGIAALADSVYVSCYKILGGIGGGVLAGPASFITECKVWLNRLGAYPYSILPYVIAARIGLERHLSRVPGYVAQAQALASQLREIPGLRIYPDPPPTNGFQVHFEARTERLQAACRALAQERRIGLFSRLIASADNCSTMGEVSVGSSLEAWPKGEAVACIRQVLAAAR